MWSRVSMEGERPPCRQKICRGRGEGEVEGWRGGGRVSAWGRQTSSVNPTPRPRPQPYLGVHQRREREVVEQVGEVLPHVGVAVLPEALVVEAVHLRDLPALVVPSQDSDALAVANLQTATRPVERKLNESVSLFHTVVFLVIKKKKTLYYEECVWKHFAFTWGKQLFLSLLFFTPFFGVIFF